MPQPRQGQAGSKSPGGGQGHRRLMQVLVVEDDAKTAEFIRKALREQGMVVHWVRDGHEALGAVFEGAFDAVVLDIMLPGRDGLSVVRQLRARNNHTPVLFLSARGDVGERVEGLEAGGDDYLCKPFALAELLARVRALGRRKGEVSPTVLRLADLTLDTTAHVAQRGGRRIELTSREYRLLEYLMRSAGRVCTRMMILERVWDYHFDPASNLVDVYVRKLRQKLDADFPTKLLHSVRGEGYVLKVGEGMP